MFKIFHENFRRAIIFGSFDDFEKSENFKWLKISRRWSKKFQNLEEEIDIKNSFYRRMVPNCVIFALYVGVLHRYFV